MTVAMKVVDPTTRKMEVIQTAEMNMIKAIIQNM